MAAWSYCLHPYSKAVDHGSHKSRKLFTSQQLQKPRDRKRRGQHYTQWQIKHAKRNCPTVNGDSQSDWFMNIIRMQSWNVAAGK